jgi:TolB protein
MRTTIAVLLVLLVASVAPASHREPVLKQIDVPHSYYYREMYLPQLTSGPSSLAWSPDGTSLVYSMSGSLWRQAIDSETAVELTSGPGYDYQPDWSPDGSSVVYVKYDRDALELWLIDLASGQSRPLTEGGAVNVEPRFSPDGKRIAYVSTAYHGHFHVFVLDLATGAATRWTGETKSGLPRYYYSAFDHELSPSWSPDGRELVFVSNRGHIQGSGGLWRMKAEADADAREIHYEETNWRARPDFSPDGKRLVYASYLGRAWHQIWLMPSEGGDVLPLTYGDFDATAPRWSPDGRRIAYVSNRSGATDLWIQEAVGGASRRLDVGERRYRRPMGRLRLLVVDPSGGRSKARASVDGADGRAYAPEGAWIHADDGFIRSVRRFEKHYFHMDGEAELAVPEGRVAVVVTRGLENQVEKRTIVVLANETASVEIRLTPLSPLPAPFGGPGRWSSGDLHVHMNYGGTYRDTPERLRFQSEAEDVDVVHSLIVNKEQRVPDIAYFTGEPDRVSTPDFLLFHAQEFHTSYWGHLGLLGLTRNILIPDYAAYPGTAAASLYPPNAVVADLAHAQGGVVGYVHPYDAPPDPEHDETLTHELVVDVALGKVDYLEVVGFSDHRSTAEVWYRFLDTGFRLPAGAGTDAMANFASLRGPVGLNRVYLRVPEGALELDSWFRALLNGNGFVTNAPLVDFTLAEKRPGDELPLDQGEREVRFTASLRSIVPIENFEVVCNGEVVERLALSGARTFADVEGTIPVAKSGWCLARAWNDGADDDVLDNYPYATTNPVYVTVSGRPARSTEDALYFLRWIDRIHESVEAHTGWNTREEKQTVLDLLSRAREVYEARR